MDETELGNSVTVAQRVGAASPTGAAHPLPITAGLVT